MRIAPDLLETAVEAARAAGRIHLEYRDRALNVRSKTVAGDFVTEVDALSEAAVRGIIGQAFPDHAILGEEEGQSGGGEARWIVDPLDGTVNYARGVPVSCVSVAFERAGERQVGVVLDPNRDELFTAVKGEGAFLNGRRLAVSGTPTLATPALVSTGFPYDVATNPENLEYVRRMLALGVALRRPGAAALDLCYVACGRFDAYWELGIKPWDAAAGSLILEEAGGRVTDQQGGVTPYGRMIVATNALLHEEILAVLR